MAAWKKAFKWIIGAIGFLFLYAGKLADMIGKSTTPEDAESLLDKIGDFLKWLTMHNSGWVILIGVTLIAASAVLIYAELHSSKSARMPINNENSPAGVTTSATPPPKPKRPPTQLPAYEVEKKLRVIDEVLAMLNSEMQTAIEKGTRLLNSWWNAYKNPENHAGYDAELISHRDDLKNQIIRLEKVRAGNTHYHDIGEIIKPVYAESVISKAEQFLIIYTELAHYFKSDVPHETFERMMKKPRQDMEDGVRELTLWRNKVRSDLNELRREITN